MFRSIREISSELLEARNVSSGNLGKVSGSRMIKTTSTTSNLPPECNVLHAGVKCGMYPNSDDDVRVTLPSVVNVNWRARLGLQRYLLHTTSVSSGCCTESMPW